MSIWCIRRTFFEMLWKNEPIGSDRFSFKSCHIQKADGDLDSQLQRSFIVFF